MEDFLEAQRQLHAAGRSLFLTLNEHSNPPEVVDRIEALLQQLVSSPGLTGVIVADLGLARFLSERFPELILVASTGLALSNSGAVELVRRLGIRRVVFPRMLHLEEMAALVERCPEVEFETFVMNDRCPNVDGLCNFVHWEVGETHFPNQCRFVRLDGATGPDQRPGNFNLSLRFREDACGACSLHALREAGVQHLKIVGRDRGLENKRQAVSFLAGLLERLAAGPLPAGEFHALARERYAETFGRACTPDQCYLPGEGEAKEPAA
ncbi:MAG: U32 family peptidase [Deltaproteobacteria bacterium]|nr:U32 family peptidase [Deltaproteobacteria bacterium]